MCNSVLGYDSAARFGVSSRALDAAMPFFLSLSMPDQPVNERNPRVLEVLAPKVAALQAHLQLVLTSRGLATANATDLGRALKLDKSLAWNLHRVARSDQGDLASTLSAMPGTRGWDSVRSALLEAGEGRDSVAQLVALITAVNDDLAKHGIGRRVLAATAGAAAAGPTTARGSREVVALRKAGADVRTMVLGVSATVAVSCYVVAPAQQQGMVGIAGLRMFDRVMQHRTRPPYVLYLSMQAWNNDAAVEGAYRPLDEITRGAPLVEDLSTEGILGNELVISPKQGKSGREFDFVGSVAGRHNALMACFGEVAPVVAPMYRTKEGERADLGCPLELPVGVGVFDIFIHRDIELGSELQLRMFSTAHATHSQRDYRARTELPVEGTIGQVEDPNSDADLATCLTTTLGDSADSAARVCRVYAELRRRAAAALGTAMSDYTLYRVVIVHPTTPSTLLASWDLPASPSV